MMRSREILEMDEPHLDESWMLASPTHSFPFDSQRAHYLTQLDACVRPHPVKSLFRADAPNNGLVSPGRLWEPALPGLHLQAGHPADVDSDHTRSKECSSSMAHSNIDLWQRSAYGTEPQQDSQRRPSPAETTYSASSYARSVSRSDHPYTSSQTPDLSTYSTSMESSYFPGYYNAQIPPSTPSNYVMSPGVAPVDIQPAPFGHPQPELLRLHTPLQSLEGADTTVAPIAQEHTIDISAAEEDSHSVAVSDGDSEKGHTDINEDEEDDGGDSDFQPSRGSRKTSQSRSRRATSAKQSRSKVSKRTPARGPSTAIQRTLSGRLDHTGIANGPDSRRPYTCPAAPYGCDTTFTSKNEWKRHVNSQHLRCGYWSCDLCPDKDVNPNNFNRKDLFTQHLRRMHDPNKGSSQAEESPRTGKKTKARVPKSFPASKDSEFERDLDNIRTRCWVQSREPPQHIECAFCRKAFGGAKGIDEWLEHAGHHLVEGKHEQSAVSIWRSDQTFRDWLRRYGLIVPDGNYGWRLVERGIGEPMQGFAGPMSVSPLPGAYDGHMEDAEGDPE